MAELSLSLSPSEVFDFEGVDNHFNKCAAIDPEDPPLVSSVEQLVSGASPQDLSPHFASWIEALARVSIQETGGHRRIPHASGTMIICVCVYDLYL